MTLEVLELENFKCFEALDLPCASLNLLTGYNGMGKSAALQALLLIAQGLRVVPEENQLPLNGDLVSLGSGGDVVRHGAAVPWFSIGARSIRECAKWTFRPRNANSDLALFDKVEYANNGHSTISREQVWPSTGNAKSLLVPTIRDAVFLNATQAMQVEAYPAPVTPSNVHGDVGTNGQYAAHRYLEHADDEVEKARRHPQDEGETVHTQVDAWLNELFPGARASADRLTPDSPIRFTFSLSKSNPWVRLANVGLGLSYAFPMLVALLTKARGSITMVDGAEAHLHPRAQSAVGRLLGQMAGAGLQIFVETHSDHLLNGVRLAVRDGLVKPDDVALHFFGQGGEVGRVTNLALDRNGAVSDWPEGFFDQAEHDLAILSGWK